MTTTLKSKCYLDDGSEYNGKVYFSFGNIGIEVEGQILRERQYLCESEFLYDSTGKIIALPEYAGWTGILSGNVISEMIDSYNLEERNIIFPKFINSAEESYNSYYILPDGRMIDDSLNSYPGHSSLGGDSKYDADENIAYAITHPNYKKLNLPTFNDLALNCGWILMNKGTDGVWYDMYESIRNWK